MTSNEDGSAMKIGVPREIGPGERRVAIVPDSARQLKAAGAEILVEAGAGVGAFHADQAYRTPAPRSFPMRPLSGPMRTSS